MKKVCCLALLIVAMSGCAGLDITPISKTKADAAHQEGSDRMQGYIVYEPMVVVEVSEVCVEKDDKGKCKDGSGTRCSAGTPFTLPDYSKPYLLNVRSGFGKAGVEVAITNGWQLGNIKDNSDNTAVLGFIEKALGFKSTAHFGAPSGQGKCSVPGLYRVTLEPSGMTLVPVKLY